MKETYLFDLFETDAQVRGDIFIKTIEIEMSEEEYEDSEDILEQWLIDNDYIPGGATWSSWYLLPSTNTPESSKTYIIYDESSVVIGFTNSSGGFEYKTYVEDDGGIITDCTTIEGIKNIAEDLLIQEDIKEIM